MTQQSFALAPLGTDQLNKLRSVGAVDSPDYASEQLVSLFSNRVVFAGQINTDLSLVQTWAQFAYNNVTVGAYTAVEVDQVLIIATTNDISKGQFYRIRLAPTSGLIYCNESSVNCAIGAYWWVIDSYLPQQRLSRPDDSGNELIDYDRPYQALPPSILGLSLGYAGYVDSVSGVLRLGFAADQTFAVEDGRTVTGWQYTFKAGTYSVAAGALNKPVVIVDFDPGEQWGKFVATDSGSVPFARHFGIKVHDPATYPVDSGFDEKGSISAPDPQAGYVLTIPAFADVDSLLPNTFGIVWRNNEIYGGVAGDLFGSGSAAVVHKVLASGALTLTTSAAHGFQPGQTVIVAGVDDVIDSSYVIVSVPTLTTFTSTKSAADIPSASCSGLAVVNPQNIDFCGWFQSESDATQGDPVHSVTATATLTFTGLGPRMARLRSQELGFLLNSSPAAWGQIINLTSWRAIFHYLARYTTVANLADVIFDDTGLTSLFTEYTTQGQNVMDVLKGLAHQRLSNVEFTPDGRIGVFKDLGHQDSGHRSSTVILLDLTALDLAGVVKSVDPDPQVGIVDADGGWYNAVSGQVTVRKARAPGHAMGAGAGANALSNLVLDATSIDSNAINQLLQAAGDEYNLVNNNEALDLDLPDGYGFLYPSRAQTVTLTLDTTLAGSHGVNRIVYTNTTQWCVESSAQQRSDNGTRIVRVRVRKLPPPGDKGDDITQQLPAPGGIDDALPDFGFPAFNFDLPELTVPDSGLTPSQIAPSALLPPRGKIAAFTGQELIVTSPARCYWLRNVINLTKPNARDITPSDLGAFSLRQPLISPAFTATAIPGFVLGDDSANSHVWYAPNVAALGPAWTVGANASGVYTVLRATKTAGTVLMYAPNIATSDVYLETFTVDALGTVAHSATTTNITKQYKLVISGVIEYSGPGSQADAFWQLFGITWQLWPLPYGMQIDSTNFAPPYQSSHIYTLYLKGTGSTFAVFLNDIFYGDNSGHYSIDLYEHVGGATVRASADNGATWGSALTVGTAGAGANAFDVQRSGGNSFGAADGIVARATTLGGSFSSYYSITGGVQATCIIVPYRNWAGARQTAAANPDITVALTGADGSGRTLLWIEGGVTPGTVHDLGPTGTPIFDNPNSITVSYQHHLACFGKVSGVYHLLTTNDRGVTWVDRGALVDPSFIRDRRDDTRAKTSGTNAGQLYLADNNVIDYSSKWGNSAGPDAGLWPRTMSGPGVSALDTVF